MRFEKIPLGFDGQDEQSYHTRIIFDDGDEPSFRYLLTFVLKMEGIPIDDSKFPDTLTVLEDGALKFLEDIVNENIDTAEIENALPPSLRPVEDVKITNGLL